MSSSSSPLPTPEGPGSASGAPNLPAGFSDTFTSRYVDTGQLRQHAVVGGQRPPAATGPRLAADPGTPGAWSCRRWPGTSRSSRPTSAGSGLSAKPPDGYDTGTLADDMVALMEALGHQRFAMVGHDTGMWIGYALAADHPDRLTRLAVAETPLPGLSPSPPLFANAHLNDALWHFAFNRLAEVNEQLVTGREEIYFGWQFATKAARQLPDYAVRYYVDALASSPEALHASFAIYRALDTTIAQNQERKEQRLSLPILAIGGGHSLGEQVGATMRLAADDVQTVVIPGCAHWVAEETPEETLAALTSFLAPYEQEMGATH